VILAAWGSARRSRRTTVTRVTPARLRPHRTTAAEVIVFEGKDHPTGADDQR
jgi:hypothetical protein